MPYGGSWQTEPDTLSASELPATFSQLPHVVVDANGNPVPGADNPVVFSVSHARLVAVDSADNASHEPFTGIAQRSAYEGRCQALVRMESGEESATLTASSPGLEPASVTFTR